MDYKSGVCNLCGTGCGHLIKTDGKQIYGLVPSQNHPTSRGKLCQRGMHLHELLNTDQRLESPMIRKNGELVSVSWREALDFLHNKISSLHHPSQSLAVLASARAANEDQYLLMRLARTVFKTNNISVGSEFGHKESLEAINKTFGTAGAIGSLAQIENAKYILVVGGEIAKMNPIVGNLLYSAKKNGARLVSVSSKRTQIAKISSQHFQVKPGIKGIFVQALSQALLEVREPKKSKNISNSVSNSLSDADSVLNLKSLGINYKKLVAEAKMIDRTPSLVVLYCSGIASLGKASIESIVELTHIAGKISHPYSGIFPITGLANLQGSYDMGLVPDRGPGFIPLDNQRLKINLEKVWGTPFCHAHGKGVYDMFANEDSKLKALFVVDHDDQEIVQHAEKISTLDFVVYVGAFKNPFTNLAHLVLPSSSYTEYDGTYTATDRRVQFSEKKLDPKENTFPAWQIYSQIAGKFGQYWKYQNTAQIFFEISNIVPGYKDLSHHYLSLNYGMAPENPVSVNLAIKEKLAALSPHQEAKAISETVTAAEAESKAKAATESKAATETETEASEDTAPNQLLSEQRCSLPPDVDYPIALMIGKAEHFWYQNNLMRKTFIPKQEYDPKLLCYPEGYIEINKCDAKKLGLRNKASAQVISRKGRMEISVRVSADVQEGTAYIPYIIKDMVSEFLCKEDFLLSRDEDTWLPVKIMNGFHIE